MRNDTIVLIYSWLRQHALREKCEHSELFWCTFSRIRTEYGYIQSKCNSEYARFLRSNVHLIIYDF